MEFRGTKGKWIVDKEQAKVIKEDGGILCICYHTSVVNQIESTPNAQLISCAPEMLECLKSIVTVAKELSLKVDSIHLDDNTLSQIGNLNDPIIQAEQLIKKATEI